MDTDTLDLHNINYNELYRIHTGHAVYESESDSSESMASASFFEENEPPLYTYEELKANSVVISVKNDELSQKKAGSSDDKIAFEPAKLLEEIKQEELDKLILPDFCYICDADLSQPMNAYSHYNSTRHKNNLKLWKVNGSVINSLEKITEEKLKDLIFSDYCYICNAILPNTHNSCSHYNSNRHKNNLYEWKSTEIKKLQTTKMENYVLKPKEPVQQVTNTVQKQSNKIETGKVKETVVANKNIMTTNYIPSTDAFCTICAINVGSGLQVHYRSDLHKRSVEAYCFVCNKKTMSKEHLSEHVKKIHEHNFKIKETSSDDLTIPQTIATPVLKKELYSSKVQTTQSVSTEINNVVSVDPLSCSICQIRFGNANVAKEHYKSINHERNVKKLTQVVPKQVPLRWCYCDICKKPLDGTEKSEEHYKEATHILQTINFYCHICKLWFNSNTGMDYHAKSFPHNEVSKLKSSVVSKGISTQEFWIYDMVNIWCTLCEVSIQSESSAFGHFGSTRHINNFNIWCSKQPIDKKDPNRRWYFCDICKECLDGTTNNELHFQGIKHAEQFKKQSNGQQITAPGKPVDITKKGTEDFGELSNSENEKYKNGAISKRICEDDGKKVVDNDTITYYCYACKIKLGSELQMTIHARSFPHNYIASFKSLLVSEGVSRQEFWKNCEGGIWCSLCKATLQGETSAKDHFRSRRHKYLYNIWYQEQPKDTKDANKKWYFCDICNIFLDGTTNAELHYQEKVHTTREENSTKTVQITMAKVSTDVLRTEIIDDGKTNINLKHEEWDKVPVKAEPNISEELKLKDTNNTIVNNNENKNEKEGEDKECEKYTLKNENNKIFNDDENNLFYCYLCKIKFNSQIELNAHVGSYTHSYIAKLKSLVVSKGISTEEFWQDKKFAIECFLCRVTISSEFSARDHFVCKRHVNNFNTWCQLQSKSTKNPDMKWYFCDICNESLDGTTNAEQHFQGKSHIEGQKKIGNSSQTCTISEPSNISTTETIDGEKVDINKKQEESNKFPEKGKSFINENLNAEIVNNSTLTVNGNKNQQEEEAKKWEKSMFINEGNWTVTENQNNLLYCYLCKIKFNLQVELIAHVRSYPHNYIAKLKSSVVSKGIYTTEFWEDNKKSIWCTLCQATMSSEFSAKEHRDCKRHVKNFNKWCELQLKNNSDSNRKLYFCDICNESLDGNAKHQFTEKSHVVKEKQLADSSQRYSPSKPPNISKTETVSPSVHSSYANLDTNKHYNKLTATEKIKNEDEDAKFLQSKMEKFMYTVKSIPLNVALKFLEDCTKELENFKKETETPNRNVKQANKLINYKNDHKKEVVKENISENQKTEKNQNVPSDNRNLNNVAEPKTSYFLNFDVLTVAAAGMLLLYFLRK